jgi:hypothetical protein
MTKITPYYYMRFENSGQHEQAQMLGWAVDTFGVLFEHIVSLEIGENGDLLVTMNNVRQIQETYGTDSSLDEIVLNLEGERPPVWISEEENADAGS